MKILSRRAVLALGGQASLLALLAGCATATPTLIPLPATSTALPPNTIPPSTGPISTAMPTSTIPSIATPPTIDLDTKIGQMLMLGFRGMEIKTDDSIAADVRDRKLGSV